MTVEIYAQQQRERDPVALADKELIARTLTPLLASVTDGRVLQLEQAFAMGGKDSAHDVFFVQAQQRNQQAGNGSAVFAVKRFRNDQSAQREAECTRAAHELGFRTLQPVGQGVYTINPDIGTVLVTEHVPRFTTMNHLGWRGYYVGQEDYKHKIALPLQRMAKFVGSLHSAGIAHGDLQVKNLGQNAQGTFVLFDLEGATFAGDNGVNNHDFIGRAGEDLLTLMKSLVSKGYLWDSTEALFQSEIQTNVLDPYMEIVAKRGSITNTSLIEYANDALESVTAIRPAYHQDFSSRIGLPS